MKILHVVTLVSPDGAFGGPLRVALNQAAELGRRGHTVHLAAGWGGIGDPPTSVDGIPARVFPTRRLVPRTGFSGLVSPRLTVWLARNIRRYDVVHVHAGRDLISLTSMAVARLKHARFVTQTHGMVGIDERPVARVLDRALTKPLLNAASSRFVLTSQEEAELAVVLGHDRFERLPNGVPQAPERAEEPDGRQVLFCARLHPRKRPQAFVQVAEQLRNRGVAATFSLVGPDEGELAAVLRAIEERGLQNLVRYEGALDYADVLDRMRKAAVYVLPSVDEPFPMTLLEALSLGLPCVCTDATGISRVLHDRGAALVTDGSVGAMTDAVSSLLSSPARRAQLSAAASQAVREVFGIEAVVTQLEAAYGR